MAYKAALIVYDNAEQLDVLGAYEAIAYTKKIGKINYIEIKFISDGKKTVKLYNEMSILPHKSITDNTLTYDAIIIPGRRGRIKAAANPNKEFTSCKEQVDSIGLHGSLILAQLGILSNRKLRLITSTMMNYQNMMSKSLGEEL